MDSVAFEFKVKVVSAERVVSLHQNREIGVVGDLLSSISEAANPFRSLQAIPVCGIDFPTSCQRLIYVFQLQQPQCRIKFAHFSIDTGRDHVDFARVAKVLQMIDADLCLGVRTNYCTTFKGGEHLGGMKA